MGRWRALILSIPLAASLFEASAQSDCQDHVQPLQDGSGYLAAVHSVLLPGASPRAYVMWPAMAFAAEAAVALVEHDGAWHVRLASVKDPIYRYKDLPGGKSALDPNVDQVPEVVERVIAESLARRIVRLWHEVLLRTRFESKLTEVTGGVGYVFFADGLSGEDANLRCGIGKVMNESALELALYARASDPISRWSIQKRVERQLSRIERNEYEIVPR